MSQTQKAKPPSRAKPKKAAKPGEPKRDDVLQAVVLADSFQGRFRPFSLERPRCLLPLVNTPLIEYTLGFLESVGVIEVFIYGGARAQEVEDHVMNSRFAPDKPTCRFQQVQFIRVEANSLGDQLRDLDKRGIVEGDFLIVHGDLVANFDLNSALAAHRARREADPECIMTSVLMPGPREPRKQAITPVFVYDTLSKRLLQYEEMTSFEDTVLVDRTVYENLSRDYLQRIDLIDPGIDICTAEVLALWSDSFDYELPRRNFLHDVLKDWELNGKKFYAEVLRDGYAARAHNLISYDFLSQDVLTRWTGPFVPSTNLLPGQTYSTDSKGNQVEEETSIEKSASLSHTAVGSGTEVGPKSEISRSTIGRNCKIGAGVRINNSYIWDGAVIGEGTQVCHSIIAENVVIGKNCSIPDGSLISFGVHISDGIAFSSPVVLSTLAGGGSPAKPDTKLLGPSAKGAPYVDPEIANLEERDPSALDRSLTYSTAHLNLSSPSISSFASDSDPDSDSDALSDVPSHASKRRSRDYSFASDEVNLHQAAFINESVNELLDGLRATGDFGPAKLEFMGLRLASNASESSVRRSVATAFAGRAAELLTPQHGGLRPTEAAGRALDGIPGAADFVREVGVGGAGVREQVAFALALQRAVSAVRGLEAARAGALLSAMLQKLYTLEVLDEEGILAWWGDARAQKEGPIAEIREKCKALVDWLQEEDEDEEDDDDDEEE